MNLRLLNILVNNELILFYKEIMDQLSKSKNRFTENINQTVKV